MLQSRPALEYCCEELKIHEHQFDQMDGQWDVIACIGDVVLMNVTYCPWCGSKLETTVALRQQRDGGQS